jgi:hypothetical protein
MLALPLPSRREKTIEAVKAAQPNQRKAVDAWASWQRLDVLGDPLVMWLEVV